MTAKNNENAKKMDKTVYLVCNAHLDPVWLWEWEEGAAAAISTFRTAANLCEEFDGFIFNHNEVILYRWVEEYEPALFKRIQGLVKAGKWHIMGGWYLQPDCNMPSGESFIRQILLGRRYFQEKFGVRPTTAINFDPFGHTRGLVQIMARSGYDSYIFCRPDQKDCPLEKDTFIWEGYDGSYVVATRPAGHYLSHLGKAREKVEQLLETQEDTSDVIVLWGVGNHGGGPSRIDLQDLTDLIRRTQNIQIYHATPEVYFENVKKQTDSLPIHRKDLNPWGVGCYTSQVRIKQKHRLLENELYLIEKMVTAAWSQDVMTYPKEDFQEVMHDLASAEFHDILPGSSIQPVEETSLRLMDHGLEILSRIKARAFFALSQGQPKARENEIPILVYNPHPYPLKQIIECEFQLADQNREETFTRVIVYQGDTPLPTQVEKELSNLNLDWRKRAVFAAELAPACMNRFDCRLEVIPQRPVPEQSETDDQICFENGEMEVMINTKTGLIDRYRVHGVDYLMQNACCPVVMFDDADPWGSTVQNFRNQIGTFHLLPDEDGQQFSGVHNPGLRSVRIIEDGPVRIVVEAVLTYENSRICQRYKLPKQGTEIEIEVRVHWNEKDRFLKLSLPTPAKKAKFIGQVAYGIASLPENGDEAVAQKWVAVVSEKRDTALTVINEGSYGSDFCYGELRLSLLRSPAYSALPIGNRPALPQDRYSPRIDQGERLFRFWLNAGTVQERLNAIDREALGHNEKPLALSFFPEGGTRSASSFITLSDDVIQMTALKKAETDAELIIRLFEPTGHRRKTVLTLPLIPMEKEIVLQGFEIRTLRVNLQKHTWTEVNLVEEYT